MIATDECLAAAFLYACFPLPSLGRFLTCLICDVRHNEERDIRDLSTVCLKHLYKLIINYKGRRRAENWRTRTLRMRA